MFVITRFLTAAIGTAAFWWLVMPAYPLDAIADGISAAAIAGYAEIMIMRLGL
jgi:hypothetical protein